MTTNYVPPMPGPLPDGSEPKGSKKGLIIVAATLGVILVGGVASAAGSGNQSAAPTNNTQPATPPSVESTAPADTADTADPNNAETAEPDESAESEETEPPAPEYTTDQEEAIEKAQSYLEYQSFSKRGLIKRLFTIQGVVGV